MRTNALTCAREKWPVGAKVEFGEWYAVVETVWRGTDGVYASVVYLGSKNFTLKVDDMIEYQP